VDWLPKSFDPIFYKEFINLDRQRAGLIIRFETMDNQKLFLAPSKNPPLALFTHPDHSGIGSLLACATNHHPGKFLIFGYWLWPGTSLEKVKISKAFCRVVVSRD
jgi:hypothetical protein